jgi:hypothetical protein
VANPPYRVKVTGGNPYSIRVRTAAQGPQGPKGDTGATGPAGANYTLPAATNSTLGGIIVGDNLTITANGRLSGTPGGVTTFNGRTGNVTLLANDVTSLANGVYLADTLSNISMSYGTDSVRGMNKTTASVSFLSGLTGLNRGVTAVRSGNLVASIELNSDDLFGGVLIRHNNDSIFFNYDGLQSFTGTANYAWSSDHFITQGRADSRYATPANLTVYQLTATNTWANLSGAPNISLYQTIANNTWSNLTGKPVLANIATTGAYSDLTGTPNLSLYLTTANAASTYYLATNPTGYITASCLTYGNITGTPNLSLYLTTANAATTYLPQANFSFANITGKPTTLSGYGITDGLTTSNASATYATISSLSSYATTASLSAYATLTTNTFTGQQNFGSNILDKPRLQALRESYSSPTISAGTLTLDLSVANNFYTSLNAAITTLSITNVPANTMEASFKLELTSDGTARAITWPGSFTWLSGSAPSVPSTNGAKTVLVAYTKDGGTSWSVGSNK